MRVLFARPDAPDEILGEAGWEGYRVRIESNHEEIRSRLHRIFRPTPIVMEDPSLRPAGASGPVEVQPGSLQWFLGVARVRGEAAGYKVVFAPDGTGEPGWDPAGGYRPFTRQVERL